MREKKIGFGIVLLKEWMVNPETGSSVNHVGGAIELVTAKDDFGFMPKGNETNWAVRVGTDERGTLVLGCQIRSIYWGKPIPINPVNGWSLA